MKNFFSIAAFIFIVLVACYPVLVSGQNVPLNGIATAGSWRLLGEKIVSFTVETDFINVTRVDVFRKLRFKILDAPVQMGDVKVIFENGEVQDIPLHFRVEEGRQSKVIDLIPVASKIKTVYFSYVPGTQGDKGKAKFILYGQK